MISSAAVQLLLADASSSSNGLTLGSGLVFAGGVIAALGAVVAAVITARAADKRLETSMREERERSDQRLAAEAERVDEQLNHDRSQVRRAEASQSLERTVRLITRNVARAKELASQISRGELPDQEELTAIRAQINELHEEGNLLGIRFGTRGELVKKLTAVIGLLQKAIPSTKEVPLSEERKRELKDASKRVDEATAEFHGSAWKALKEYD